MELVSKAEITDNTTFFRDEDAKLIGAVKLTDIYKAKSIDLEKEVQAIEDKIMAERLAYRRKTEHDEAIKLGLDIALGIIEDAKIKIGG